MIRKLIYTLKRLLQSNPAIYSALFQLASLNRDVLRLWLGSDVYPSRFGGLWTDSHRFDNTLSKKLASGAIGKDQADQLKSFHQDGYLILNAAIPETLIDQYLNDLKTLSQEKDSGLLLTAKDLPAPTPYSSELERTSHSSRMVDDYFFLPAARNVLFHSKIREYLELLFETQAILTQSLSFTHGSEQGMHRDTAFVRMNSPMKLLGVWVALEDVSPGSGELIYFPGSHHWPDYLFSRYFKHYDEERDGPAALDDNYRWLYQQATDRGVEETTFQAKKGDVLIWHADLAHGGAPVNDKNTTRKSLVGHFCPQSVSPLYVYYKPRQRRRYQDQGREFMTSYYRDS